MLPELTGEIENWTSDDAMFKISSYSGGPGCVAVARFADGSIRVRTDLASGETLVFTEHEWDAFVLGVKKGEFDSP